MNAWGITDRGVVRQQNQDYFHLNVLHDSSLAVCSVCDGMGGARSGNVASVMAVDAFIEETELLIKPGMNGRAMKTALLQAVSTANARIYEKGRSDPACYGMGTTMVCALVTPSVAVIANVGDSRAYIVDKNGIERVTRDHSVVEDLLAMGELSREEAKTHPSKNLVTRALGTDESVKPDVFTVELREGDYVLLCSDGLTNTVEDQEILYEVIHGGDPSKCCRRLMELANERGGPDNITIVLISV